MHTYVIHFYTGTQSWAGTNANVDITIYGSNGESDNYIFKNEGENTFESGMKNSFTISTIQHLGSLAKIRVGHDNAGVMPAWFLIKMEVDDYTSGEIAEFECNKWFDMETGDGRIRRYVRRNQLSVMDEGERVKRKEEMLKQHQQEIVVIEEIIEIVETNDSNIFESQPTEEILDETPEKDDSRNILNDIFENELKTEDIEDEITVIELPDHKYTISFHTGTVMFAGTDANVFVTLYGKTGESENFRFENKGNTTFENGMINSFEIDSDLPLRTISQLRVGHDSKGLFPGWFLSKIEIKDNKSEKTIRFPCEQWITEKVLPDLKREETEEERPATPPILTKSSFTVDSHKLITYTVHIVTEVANGSLSDEDIIFTLYGKDGQSGEQRLNQTQHQTSPKRLSKIIQLHCFKHLGSLEKIRIGLGDKLQSKDKNGKGTEEMPWFLVKVEDPKALESVVFMCNCSFTDEQHSHSPHEHHPFFANTKNDIINLDNEDDKDWSRVHEINDADIRKQVAKLPNTPPIVKAVLKLDNASFPHQTAVTYFTNWEERKRWDTTFTDIEILEQIGNFTLVKCVLKMPLLVKKRELVLACLDHPGQRSHVQTMCNAFHPRAPFDSQKIRAQSLTCGIVVHKPENHSKFAKITVINQIELDGWMPYDSQVNYFTNTSIEQIDLLKKYLQNHNEVLKSKETSNTNGSELKSLLHNM